jgi:hypothetical protein
VLSVQWYIALPGYAVSAEAEVAQKGRSIPDVAGRVAALQFLRCRCTVSKRTSASLNYAVTKTHTPYRLISAIWERHRQTYTLLTDWAMAVS